MAKLDGVKTISDREIEYGGVRYVMTEGPAQLSDIVRSETFDRSGVEYGDYFLVDVSRWRFVGFVDDDGDTRGIDEDGTGLFDYEIDGSEITPFRRVESAPQSPQSPAEIRALIEQKRAEIAELEAQLEIREDDYVRVVGRSYSEEFTEGDIAQVTLLDESDDIHPYKIRAVIGGMVDWARESAVVKITPAEAKAALIAQIEEAFLSA